MFKKSDNWASEELKTWLVDNRQPPALRLLPSELRRVKLATSHGTVSIKSWTNTSDSSGPTSRRLIQPRQSTNRRSAALPQHEPISRQRTRLSAVYIRFSWPRLHRRNAFIRLFRFRSFQGLCLSFFIPHLVWFFLIILYITEILYETIATKVRFNRLAIGWKWH